MRTPFTHKSAFTLIEIIIGVTIFSIIMISVISVYIFTTRTAYKADVHRAMQENIKSIMGTLSEEIMQYGISGLDTENPGKCAELKLNTNGVGDKLCVGAKSYFLAEVLSNGKLPRADSNACADITKNCALVVKHGNEIDRLTNNLVKISLLNFRVTNDGVKKVTILLKMKPTRASGVAPNFLGTMELPIQLTISERADIINEQ